VKGIESVLLEQQGKYNTLTEFFFSTNQSVKQSDFGGAE
jgi:hypothetical protein